MRDVAQTESSPFMLEELCRLLERHRGSLSFEHVIAAGFVGTKIVLRLQPPHRKPVVHEALRPDERISGRALPTFANELEQMVHHLKLAYPELEHGK